MDKAIGNPESHLEPKQDPQSNMALRTFIRENYDVKMLFTNTFTCMPSHKTPPSSARNTRPFNPFNQNLKERLENATLSPTVFENVVSPREVSSTELRWTIDDISKCNPANIDEESHIDAIDNEETREDVQQAIDKYFSQTNMPSPWDVVPRDFSSPMTATPGSACNVDKKDNMMSSTPKKSGSEQRIKFVTSVCTQTMWSLPPKLPDHIEEMLKPYFNVVKDDDIASVDEEESILSVSNLRRKLDFSRNHFSPQRFDTDDSMGSDTSLDKVDRFGTPLPLVSSPDVSPIHNSKIRKGNSSGSSSSRLNFTQDMNVCTLSAECNDESAISTKSDADASAMSMMICSQQAEKDEEFLCPLPLTVTADIPSQDTGYHTDVTGMSGSCSQANNSEELVSKENNDVTYGWSGFTHHLEQAQMDSRHPAASTPTKTTKHNL